MVPLQPGFASVLLREGKRIVDRPLYVLMTLILPGLSFLILVGTFRAGVPAKLPVAVVDLDHSALSRDIVRSLGATRTMAVSIEPDLEAAVTRVRRGEAYAVITLPARMERDLLRGEAATIVCHGEAQYILPFSLIRRAARQVAGDASARLEIRWRIANGQSVAEAKEAAEPAGIEVHTLFNPAISYVPYFLPTVLPAMLQIFVIMTCVDVLGSELKERTGGALLACGGGKGFRVLAGKLLLHSCLFFLLALLMLTVLFPLLGIRVRGSFCLILAASGLFVLAGVGVALIFVAATANLRMATSLAAIYSAPAFAFSGSAFPTIGMPLPARIWSALLPLSHFVRLLVQQASRGAAPATAVGTMACLGVFFGVGVACGAPRYVRLLGDPRFGGSR